MATTAAPDPRVARLVQQGQAAQRAGDARAARTLFDRALEMDPRQPAALNALGMAALRADDAAGATRWFERATQADPAAGPLWLNLATARRVMADDAGERAALERALALDQRNVMANYRLAELLDRLGAAGATERWQGVATMLAGADDLSPELERVRALAQKHVAERGAVLGEAIDAALADAREVTDGRMRRRFDACVDAMLGRRRVFLNECHGLHFPFLPADEFFDRVHFGWLAALEAETAAIRAEFEALYAAPDAGFAPYVDMGEGSPDNRWSRLDGSSDWSARYLWRFGERDDAVCGRCPRTAAAIAAAPRVELAGQAPTAFFSVLAPGARLPAHSGVSNIRAIVHLPLVVPPGCGFRVGGEVREWREGEAFAFDDTIEHEAWNEGDRPRAVLILDVWNPHLSAEERAMLQTLFGVLRVSGSGLGSAAD